MNGRALRDDRGDVPAGYIVLTMLMVVIAIVLTVVIRNGVGPLDALLLFLAIIGASAVLAGVGVAVAAIGERRQTRRRRDLDWRMGPALREWMGTERLDDAELKWWRECEHRGVTVQLARQWADDELAYPLLLASPGLAVEQRSVRALATVMHEAGAWDGTTAESSST